MNDTTSLILGAASAVPSAAAAGAAAPGLLWCAPFACLLLAIALFPLVPKLAHWWERNRSKLAVSFGLALLVCGYYAFGRRETGGLAPNVDALGMMLRHAVADDYVPFIILLFALYTISGGIRLTGDIPAHPATNTGFLLLGAVLANLIGTTGASVLLVRPLLQINSERRHTTHTFVFFIFLVSNIGGLLLPIGDPPLFLGYLRGVPFFWTLKLLPLWVLTVGAVLALYVVVETFFYRKEPPKNIQRDETLTVPFRLHGGLNFVPLLIVVLAVAILVPGRRMPLLGATVPDMHLRELVLLALTGVSFLCTPRRIYRENAFNFHPIGEVACLFIGVFITMQVPIELLRAQGLSLGIQSPMQFFWATGLLSGVLDNAPTYVVFYELAGILPDNGGAMLHNVATATGQIPVSALMAISAGSVLMGAITYIGNGPNFLVKSIAESRGVAMPSFFGYLIYSVVFLLPVFGLVSLIFFR